MSTSIRRCALRVAAVTLACALGMLAGAAPAFAHTRLVSSDPPDGASLDSVPQRVSLTFNEPMQAGFATITVIGPDSTRLPVRRGDRDRRHGRHPGRPARARPAATRSAIGWSPRTGTRSPGRSAFTADHPRPGGRHPDAGPGRRRRGLLLPTCARYRRRGPGCDQPADDGGPPVWPWIVGGVVLIGAGAVAALRLGRG